MANATSNYGRNLSSAPASIAPGQYVERNTYMPDLSDARESIIANGVRSNSQIRRIDSKPGVAPAFGMRDRGDDTAKIPTATSRRK